MDKIEEIILLGLYKFGRKKKFGEILLEAGEYAEETRRMEIAATLEAAGHIQDVTYQLPLAIRARLSVSGEALARSIAERPTPPNYRSESGFSALLIFLQLNLDIL